jgi:tetratricopeptide (TPR) repeat protein
LAPTNNVGAFSPAKARIPAWIACFILGLNVAAAASAVPATPAPVETAATTVVSAVDAAKLLIASGRLDEAQKLLESLSPPDSEILFLLGTIASEKKNYSAAISYFRRILVDEPNAERVRLELGRAFYLEGDYDNAITQFQRARAGDVPDAVKANIDRYLFALSREKEWSFRFSAALAPDTDENAATSIDQINLYGLPFTLNSQARKSSGVGVFGDLFGEWSPLISADIKARIGAEAFSTDYRDSAFDDSTLAVYAGPQFLFGDWDLSPLLTAFNRWYGNKPFVDGRGARMNADFGITSSWQLAVSLGAQEIRYAANPLQGGPLYSSQIAANYTLSPSSAVQVLFGINRQDADPAYSYTNYWIGAGYQQDLQFGFSASFRPSYFITPYDAALAGFGIARSDHMLLLQLDLLNRRLDYWGFTPKFTYIFTDQQSNIALFRYTRSQFQIGVTSQF